MISNALSKPLPNLAVGDLISIASLLPPENSRTRSISSTDRLCRRGAAAKNLSQSACAHCEEITAPSKPVIKPNTRPLRVASTNSLLDYSGSVVLLVTSVINVLKMRAAATVLSIEAISSCVWAKAYSPHLKFTVGIPNWLR